MPKQIADHVRAYYKWLEREQLIAWYKKERGLK